MKPARATSHRARPMRAPAPASVYRQAEDVTPAQVAEAPGARCSVDSGAQVGLQFRLVA